MDQDLGSCCEGPESLKALHQGLYPVAKASDGTVLQGFWGYRNNMEAQIYAKVIPEASL